VTGIVDAFEKPYMTILIGWKDAVFDVKVINFRRSEGVAENA
jgi:hypothetical protein